MSFPVVDKLKEALKSWRNYRRDEDLFDPDDEDQKNLYSRDPEENFLKHLACKYADMRENNGADAARKELAECFAATGGDSDDDRPWALEVLVNWVIDTLVPLWPRMAWIEIQNRWAAKVLEKLLSMKQKGFVLHKPAAELLKKQTMAVALVCLEHISGSGEKVISEKNVRFYLSAVPAPASSAAGGAAQPAPEPEAGSGASDKQEKRAGGKRKRDDSDDDCVFVKEEKTPVIYVRD